MERFNIREVLDSIAEGDEEATVEDSKYERQVSTGMPRIYEIHKRRPKTQLDILKIMRDFDSLDLGDAMRYLGDFYFEARSKEINIWRDEDEINWIDTVWLRVAKHEVSMRNKENIAQNRPALQPAMPTDHLISGLRNALSIEYFGTETLQYHDLKVLLERLCMFYVIIDAEKDGTKATALLRLCTRFVSAVAYMRMQVIGDRAVRLMSRTNADNERYTKALAAMLSTHAKNLPDQAQDDMQEVMSSCIMPVDAATTYAMTSSKLGIYAGDSRDVATVLATCDDVEPLAVASLCDFVPWDRPGKPHSAIKIPRKKRWLLETWEMHVFAFLFHSAHCTEAGLWSQGSGTGNVFDAGMFCARYLLAWRYIMQPSGLKKLQMRKRFHKPTLPMIIQAGNSSWWVRTTDTIWVCQTVGSAIEQFDAEVKRVNEGKTEDVVAVKVGEVCPNLLAPPPPPAPPSPVIISASVSDSESVSMDTAGEEEDVG